MAHLGPARFLSVVSLLTSVFAGEIFAQAPGLIPGQRQLTFLHLQDGNAPAPQVLSLSSDTSVRFSATSRSKWLTVTPESGVAPADLSVTVIPEGLTQGVYRSTVTVSEGGTPQSIPVTLFVSGPLSGKPKALRFASQKGQAPPPQTIQLEDHGTPFTGLATAVSTGNWLTAGPAGGTPGAVRISVDPEGLKDGVYNGFITAYYSSFECTGQRFAPSRSLTSQAAQSLQNDQASPALVAAAADFNGDGLPDFVLADNADHRLSIFLARPEGGFQLAGEQPLPESRFPYSLAAGDFDSDGKPDLAVAADEMILLLGDGAGGFKPPSHSPLSMVQAPGGVPNLAIATSPETSALRKVCQSYSGTPVDSIAANSEILAVTLQVGTPSPSTLSSSSLTFDYVIGGTLPPAQTVNVSGPGSIFSISTSPPIPSWITINPQFGNIPGSFTVSVNPNDTVQFPNGAVPGTYTFSTFVNDLTVEPLSITLNISQPTVAALPNILTFSFLAGGPNPPDQTVSITSTGGALTFTAAASSGGTVTTGPNWLSVTPASGTTTGTLTVSVNPAGLAAGFYGGSITVTSPAAGNSPIFIFVDFTVEANLVVDKPSLTLNTLLGGSPATQSLQLTSSGVAAPFQTSATTANGIAWLTVAPIFGTTPGTLTVTADPTGLPIGSYQGTVTINSFQILGTPARSPRRLTTGQGPRPRQLANPTTTVDVTLNVAVPLSATPSTLAFNYLPGGPLPTAATVSVTASGGATAPPAIPFTATSSAAWLTATPTGGTTPGSLSVSVDPKGLAGGTYTGTITITSANASNGPQTVTATLTVVAPLSVAPSAMTFTALAGGAPPASQTFSVSSASGGPVGFTVTSSAGWLAASAAGGTTPVTLSASVDPGGLGPGTYNGTITISGPSGVTKLAVTMTVTVPLAVSPQLLRFNSSGGATPASQTIAVSAGAGAAIPYTARSSAAWLSAGAAGTTPGSFAVSVDPTGLGPGTFNGIVTVESPAASNSPQTVAVTLVVTVSLSASPSSLAFSYLPGAATPPPQTISVAAVGGDLSYDVTSSAAWLKATPASGITPGSVAVSVDPSGLAPGSYTGTVTIHSGAALNALTATVTLTVTTSLATSPTNLSFSSLTAGSSAPTQQVLVTSGGAPIGIAVAVSTSSGGTWLSATPVTAITPASITVGADMKGLAPGTYNGTITISSPKAPAPQTISVTLVVAAGGDLVLSPSTLTFTANKGTAPTSQTISVTSSTSTPLPFSVSADITGGAISVTPQAATTPALVTVTIDPGSVSAGSYSGHVQFSVAQKPYVANVELTVKDSPPVLSVAPGFLDFRPASGSTAVLSQALQIQNSGGGPTQQFSVGVTEGSWLSLSATSGTLAGNQAATVQVRVNPQGLAPGPYLGSIRVQMGNSSQDVSVSLLVVAAQPYIGLEFSGLQFEARTGEGLTYTRDVSVFNRGAGNLTWTATVLSGGDWLSLDSKTGKFTVITKPGSLEPRAYYGTIQITDAHAANSPQLMMVVLNVLPVTAQAVPIPSPGGLLFVAGGGAAPAPQTIQVFTSSTAAVSFQAAAQTSDGANWLSISPASDFTSTGKTGSVTVAVNPAGLKAGVYQGGVSFSISGIVRTANVTLIVPPSGAAAPNAKSSPQEAGCAATKLVPVYTGLVNNFSSPAGWPTAVTVRLVDDCGSAVPNGNIVLNFSKGQPNFLTMNQSDSVNAVYTATWVPAATAAQINVLAKATAGLLQGTAQVSGAVSENAVPVLVPNGTRHQYNQLKEGLALAPGTIVSIYGSNLAQDSASPNPGTLPTELSGTQVLIGGRAAPLYYISKGLINAQVPMELEPRAGYQVLVSVNGALSVPDPINLVPAQPGVVAFDSGQVVAQHSSDFRLVTSDAPAAPGEALIIYLAGMGATNPGVQSGVPSPSDSLAWTKLPTDVSLDGQPAQVLYTGLAPYFVGLYQINFVVPQSAANGNLKLTISQDGREANTTVLPVRK